MCLLKSSCTMPRSRRMEPPRLSRRLLFLMEKRHPEAKSLAPDGTACAPETTGLLKRARMIAGDIRYVGKETDRKWEEGETQFVQ